ncbi:MAG: hypothetical protein WBB17_06010 [Saprospiraceae bacterium]
MTTQEQIQKQFFDYLVKRRGLENVIHGTMEALMIKKGATYKRMNGETALTTTELITLARHFHISLDTIFSPEKYITFEHPFTSQKTTADFMSHFTYFLKPLGSMEQSQLTYLANELPVFYYFSHKYIFNFLISVWSHLHWTDTRLIIEENIEVTQQIEFIRNEITTYYEGHPVTEIWNSNMFANLYQQIIFSITIRAFKEEKYIFNLIKDIDELIDHLRALAMNEFNESNGNKTQERKIYLNDYGNYLNLVLYESSKIKSTFIGFDIPQFMVSYNPAFNDFAKSWVRKIKKRSVLISSEGYQNREMFFIKMENDHKSFIDKVEKLLAIYYR